RCHKMLTEDVSDLGDRWNWFNGAVNGGQPAAEATAVQLRLAQERLSAMGKPKSDWLPEGPVGGDAADGDPHRLALKALQSLDPDAMLTIAYMTHHLNPRENPQEETFNRLAWTIVACQRGADCSECALNACDTNVMMRTAGNNWDAVQQRARE